MCRWSSGPNGSASCPVGTHRSSHEDVVADGLAGQLGGAGVQLPGAAGERAVLQPDRGTSEAAGQHEITAGLGEAAVQGRDLIRGVEHPLLARHAGLDAHVLEVGARGSVGQQHAAVLEHLVELRHAMSLARVGR